MSKGITPSRGGDYVDSGYFTDVAAIAFAFRLLGPIDLIPEIRYLHWTVAYERPSQDQACSW
jgi:hypothetical protein